jgi:hypothetical protein
MANQTAACLATFGNCRKTQDVAGPAISTCDQDSGSLTSKLKQLTTNQDLVNSAQEHITRPFLFILFINFATISLCQTKHQILSSVASRPKILQNNPKQT